jgi:hypothetical protein
LFIRIEVMRKRMLDEEVELLRGGRGGDDDDLGPRAKSRGSGSSSANKNDKDYK